MTGSTPGNTKDETMGTVYRKTATKPLPAEAKLIVRKGQRLAEWLDAKERRRTAPVTTGKDGTDRVVITARTYTAKYRDGSGIVREVATGCRDETAARSVLGDLERRAEKVKGGILTADEAAAIDHQGTPLTEHVAAYVAHQTAKGLNPVRVKNSQNRLARLGSECGFRALRDLSAASLERWLVARQAEGMGAGTRNEYRQELVGFGNWCVRTRRLLMNPFSVVSKADAKADCRRKRRALTEPELLALLDVAHRLPLLDAMTIRQGRLQGEAVANLGEGTRRRPDRPGRERALIYKALVLTGLRKGELASLTVGQLDLNADPPYVVLDAADEKNREGSTIPLRADLAADLREWLAEKAKAAQEAARDVPAVAFDPEAVRLTECHRNDSRGFGGQTCPQGTAVHRLPADTPVFVVPTGLRRILDRDLKAAGIPKRDERGRTVDVHAMRTTFGTLLSKGGVSPRTAQAAMRHSTIDLTMNTYTDPKLLDVVGAMEALPSLPLSGGTQREGIAVRATGTEDFRGSQFAPAFAPTPDKSRVVRSTPVRLSNESGEDRRQAAFAASAYPVKQSNPLTSAVNGSSEVERRRVELPTSALRTQRSPN